METKDERIKKYVLEDSIPEQDFIEKMALIYKDKDYLRNKGLWDDNIRKKVASYNTLHNFTYVRLIQIKDNLMAYSSLYIASKYSLDNFENIECDVLALQDYFLSKGIEYVQLNTWDIIEFIQINRSPTKEFVKYLHQEDALCESMKNDPMYFSMLVEIEDIESLIERYKLIQMDTETKYKFISRIDYKEWNKFTDLFDDEFLIKHLGSFRYYELCLLRDKRQIHDIMSKATYQERFKLYEKLETNQVMINETRKELKSLVRSNLEKKITTFKTLCNKEPISVINEIINQITVFPSLIPLISEIIKVMGTPIKDIFVFCVLRYMRSQDSFVKGDHFAKWFVNVCSLIKSIQKDIDTRPILDWIRDLLRQNRFSCVLLLESVQLPDDIRKCCKSIYKKVFTYEDYSLKLKMDVSDKYSILINRKFKLKPSTTNLKFMTLFEIESIGPESLVWVIKLIIDTQDLEDDYFAIRNFAMIIRKFIDDLKDYHSKIKLIFDKFVDYDEEDIRVLCCSLISKIMSYEKMKGNSSVKKSQENPDDTTLSEPKRMKLNTQDSSQIEKGEIVKKVEQPKYNENQVVNRRMDIRTVFDQQGRPILHLEDFVRSYTQNYRDSFHYIIRMNTLPVYDANGRHIPSLYYYLYGKQDRNFTNYDNRRR